MQVLPAPQGQVAQQDSLSQAALHQAAHQLVSLAEGHPLSHQVVGHIGGVGEIRRHCRLQALGPKLEPLFKQNRHRLQAIEAGTHPVKQGLLVFLEVLVVGEGQALDHGQQTHQVAKHPAALTPHQLGHIRVLFLGHQAAASRTAVGEANKAKLFAGPENHLLTEPA